MQQTIRSPAVPITRLKTGPAVNHPTGSTRTTSPCRRAAELTLSANTKSPLTRVGDIATLFAVYAWRFAREKTLPETIIKIPRHATAKDSFTGRRHTLRDLIGRSSVMLPLVGSI